MEGAGPTAGDVRKLDTLIISEDAFFLDSNPLQGLHCFTVEVIIRPDSKGLKEQRFLHMGEIHEDRVDRSGVTIDAEAAH